MGSACGRNFDDRPAQLQAFAFAAASTQYADVASNAGFVISPGEDATIVGWFKPVGAGSHNNERIFSKWNTNPNIEYMVFCNAGGNLLNFIVFTTTLGFATASPITTYTDDVWNFFVARWNHTAGAISLTVNNDTANTSTIAGIAGIHTSGVNVSIGIDNALTPGTFFNGDVGTIAFYKRLLTPAEETTLFNAGVNNKMLSDFPAAFHTNLTAWYDAQGNFNDSSGNANTLTPHNNPTFVNRP